MTTLLNKAEARRHLLARAKKAGQDKSRVSEHTLSKLEDGIKTKCGEIIADQGKGKTIIGG